MLQHMSSNCGVTHVIACDEDISDSVSAWEAVDAIAGADGGIPVLAADPMDLPDHAGVNHTK